MKNLLIATLVLVSTVAQAAMPVPATTPVTRDMLRNTTPAGIRSTISVQATNNGIAESYCQKAHTTSYDAKQNVSTFVNGLYTQGLLTNLIDFAFFEQGNNNVTNPVSWRNTGTVVGALQQYRGGFYFNNLIATNWLYFTNLPPTPNGRTLVYWGSQAFQGTSNGCTIAEMTVAGSGTIVGCRSVFSSLHLFGYSYDGTYGQQFSDSVMPQYYASDNDFFCGALSSHTNSVMAFMDKSLRYGMYPAYPIAPSNYVWSGTANISSPVVVRFGYTAFTSPANGWNGLIRGFALFDKVLTSNQVQIVNNLVPRVGVLVDGDSKSGGGAGWQNFWIQTPDTWGWFEHLTNSSVAGKMMSAINQGSATAVENHWSSLSQFKPTTKNPVILLSLRGAYNDVAAGTDVAASNALVSLKAVWAAAHTNGTKVLAWTVDRTTNSWLTGSNQLVWINKQIRDSSGNYDYLFDVSEFLRNRYGETPYTQTNNPAIYNTDQIHEALDGNWMEGTNGVVNSCWDPRQNLW